MGKVAFLAEKEEKKSYLFGKGAISGKVFLFCFRKKDITKKEGVLRLQKSTESYPIAAFPSHRRVTPLTRCMESINHLSSDLMKL